MSTIDKATVEKIAHLARLALTDEEIPLYAKNLSNILQLVEQMDQVDTSNVSPMAHPLDLTLRFRNDVVTEHNERDAMQKGAHAEMGLYLVPQVIE